MSSLVGVPAQSYTEVGSPRAENAPSLLQRTPDQSSTRQSSPVTTGAVLVAALACEVITSASCSADAATFKAEIRRESGERSEGSVGRSTGRAAVRMHSSPRVC